MENEKNDNNVIEFPTRKLESESAAPGDVKFDFERKKVMISASLVSIVFAATFINASLIPETGGHSDVVTYDLSSSERNIASVDRQRAVSDWEKDMAELLSKKPARGLASMGRAPSAEDRLRYGRLGGNYLIRYDQGKLQEIIFQEQAFEEAKNEPSYLTNPEEFLMEYKELMPVSFSEAKPKAELKIGGKVQVYSLRASGKDMAEVKFSFDRFGRFINMKIVTL